MFVFISKQYPENFGFLILKIIELLAREVCKLLKRRLIFNILYCFGMFVNKLIIFLRAHISKSESFF